MAPKSRIDPEDGGAAVFARGAALLAALAAAFVGAAGAAWAQEQPPAAEYSHLLNLRFDELSGKLTVGQLVLVAPPQPEQTAELVLATADGRPLSTVPLQLRRWQAFPGFAGLTPRGEAVVEHPGRDGDYVLSVRVGGKEVTALPYSLAETLSGDSYSSQVNVFVREGPWRSLAYLAAAPAAPGEALDFHWWASEREMPGGWGNTRAVVRVLRDGAEVAVGAAVTVVSAADWQPLRTRLVRPESAGGGGFTLADLTAADGEYTIAVEARKTVLKKFTATVAGGTLARLDRCRPEALPSPAFISPRLVDTSAGGESGYRLVDAYWLTAGGS